MHAHLTGPEHATQGSPWLRGEAGGRMSLTVANGQCEILGVLLDEAHHGCLLQGRHSAAQHHRTLAA